MDSLRRRVREYDLQRNTSRQIEVTTREQASTLICIKCRRVPDVHAAHMAWYAAHKDKWGYAGTWPGVGTVCPDCGGRLETVTW